MSRHLLNRDDVEYINEQLSNRHANDSQTRAVCGCLAPISIILGGILQWKIPWTIHYNGIPIPVWASLGVLGLIISYFGIQSAGTHFNDPNKL